MSIRNDAEMIIKEALENAMPGTAMRKALSEINFGTGRLLCVAAGKAAWEMAKACAETIPGKYEKGIVITKYDHSKGEIPGFSIFEAGHPVPDENSYAATEKALELVSGLTSKDSVLFLLSGGGSALFEKPLIPEEEMEDITKQFLSCGAEITEINTIRKRLSAVKGGKFALACAPAHVYTVVLSDIIGDPLDMIASGPAYPDSSTKEDALEIVSRYGIRLSEKARGLLETETPKTLENVTTYVTGSVRELCASAEKTAKGLGYETVFLTASLSCEAREAGAFLSSIAKDHQNTEHSLAFLLGGETVVHLTGKGKGGRNQEIALSAAQGLKDCKDTLLFSVGSDGTDGPTDAAGGIVDETTFAKLSEAGFEVRKVLAENNAYPALSAADALLMTGPTGTNVNDLTVLLIKR